MPRAERSPCSFFMQAANAYSKLAGRAVGDQGADRALHAARARWRGGGTADRGFRPGGAAGAQAAGYDGVEIMGSERLPSEPVPRRAHEPTRDDAWGGSYENRMRLGPWRSCDRGARDRGGPNFHRDLPASRFWTSCRGGLDLGRGGRACAGRGSGGGPVFLNTGIGWHEAAHSHDRGPACRGRRLRLGDREAPPRSRPAGDRLEPDQRARGRRRRSSPMGAADLVSMARPFLADPEFSSGKGRRTGRARPDRAPASPATKACLDHTFEAGSPPASSNTARGPRDGTAL